VNVSRIFRVLGLHSVIKTLSIDSGYHILWWLAGQAPRLLRMLMRSSREPRRTAMGSSNVSTPRDCSLDDRFHEGCQKGGIHLRLEAPIYGPVGLGQGVEHHGSVAEGDRVVARR
jgi:hypothetical protein